MEVCWHAMALSRDCLPMRAVADTGGEVVVEAILSISAAAVPQRPPNEELTDTSKAAKNWLSTPQAEHSATLLLSLRMKPIVSRNQERFTTKKSVAARHQNSPDDLTTIHTIDDLTTYEFILLDFPTKTMIAVWVSQYHPPGHHEATHILSLRKAFSVLQLQFRFAVLRRAA